MEQDSSILYSTREERHALSGLLKYPHIYAELDGWVDEEFFYDQDQLHATIFKIITRAILDKETVDATLIATRIKNLGIKFQRSSDWDIYSYLQSLSLVPIEVKAVIPAFKELEVFKIKRNLVQVARQEEQYVLESANTPIQEVINGVDQIHGKKTSHFKLGDEPQDLYSGIVEDILDKAENPIEEIGLVTPFTLFNDYFGGLRNKNVYAVVSRPKHSKSTWLAWMADEVAEINNCKVLYLDTEMFHKDIAMRMAAARTGISMHDLETGGWRNAAKDPDVAWNKIKLLRKRLNRVKHFTVQSVPIQQVMSIARRWYINEVGKGNPCMVIYDYLKLTGEKLSQNWSEHQAIGEKTDRLKELSDELDCPLFTACQLNRKAEDGVDDSSAIAQSDRLQWFASFVAIFRRKFPQEFEEQGDQWGTHSLIPLATRFQGKRAQGHSLSTQFPNPRRHSQNRHIVKPFFLNFSVRNFKVEEMQSSEEVAQHMYQQYELEDDHADERPPSL